MAVEFRIKPHSICADIQVVEILIDGQTVGVMYPMRDKGIKLVSAHMEMEKTEIEKDFAGEVVKDDGSRDWPPIPAVLITFNPSPYTIIGNKIVKKEERKMAEIIQTPIGKEKVLKPEELIKQVKNRDTSKYVWQLDGTYKCRDCDENILTTRIAYSVWDGPFPMSGSGRCVYEVVRYCPKCEQEPDCHGSPVAPKGSYHNP